MAAQTSLPETGFARSLQAANSDVWNRMQQHRFVTDVVADRLDPTVFRRYLVFEHAFVKTAVLIFGHAMLKAPGFAQRRRLIGVLHSLAEEQLPYFARVFVALGIAAPPPERALPAAVRLFDRGMLGIAEVGSYAEILAIMLAAEWMYASWCLRAARSPAREPELRRWVALHAEPDFLDQVGWLMCEIDREAARLKAGGVDGLIVENHGDIPFVKPDQLGPETASTMAVITDAVRRSSGLPIGVNVLANGAIQALAVAKAAGARFVRVNQWANAYVANEGLLDGPAGQATRYRAWLRAQDVRIFADVHVKHGAHAITGDRTIPELARDVEFFDADVTIATGPRTGDAASLDEIRLVAEGCGLPVVVGSGVNAENIGDIFTVADGVIVASYLKRDGVWWNEVDPERLRHFMAEADRARR